MERFAKGRESWLRKYLKLPHGMPSNDTFRRIFSAIDPKEFNACFISFVQGLQSNNLSSELIAIDGKAVRHSFDSATETKHLHLLSAYACEQGLSLAQLAVDIKSNEINAVPKLLDLLDLEGHTISLDAIKSPAKFTWLMPTTCSPSKPITLFCFNVWSNFLTVAEHFNMPRSKAAPSQVSQ